MKLRLERRHLIDVLALLSGTVFALLLAEIILRAATPGAKVLEWRNYTTEPPGIVIVNRSRAQYDPAVGRIMMPNRMDLGQGPIGNRLPYPTKAGDPVPPLPVIVVKLAGA